MTGRAIRAAGLILVTTCAVAGAADEPKKADPPGPAAILTDAAGKEVALSAARFTSGVRRLGWLGDAKAAPLALEVREPHSTTYLKGVVTLVPFTAVEAVRYDYAKQTMAVAVKGLPAPVEGTLQFKGINTYGVEGSAGGVVGKFAGGLAKDGFKAITFTAARPLPAREAGPAWRVTIDHPKAMHPTLAVRRLKALYAAGTTEWLADDVPTRKGAPLKLDAGAVKQLEVLAVDTNTQTAAAELTPPDGPPRLVVFPLTREHAGKTGVLVGLLGEVDAGWKLFPLHAVKLAAPAP